MRTVFWSVLLLISVSCGEPAAVEPVAPPVPATPEHPREPRAESAAAPVAIGWDHVPVDPPLAARAANASALRLHGEASGAPEGEARRIYLGSLAAFETVAREHPDYLAARFNVACALSRLGRHADAIVILTELLSIDLPTFSPRLDSDPDLASLSAAAEHAGLLAHREALRARFAAALQEGVPVVSTTPLEIVPAPNEDTDATHRQTFQAGVWLPRERRFVPLAPRIVREANAQVADLVLTATFVDRERGAVLSFEGMGTWSEGGGPVASGTLTAHTPDGSVRATLSSGRGPLAWAPPIDAHLTADGIALRHISEPDFEPRTSGGLVEDLFPRLEVSLAHASVLLPREPAPEGVSIRGDMLSVGEARLALPAAHHFRRGPRIELWARRDDTSHWLLTAGLVDIEWGSMGPGAVALSVVRVTLGVPSVELIDSESVGLGALVRGPDGSVYAQVGARVLALRVDGAPEPLPSGLLLLPTTPARYGR